MSQLCSMQRKLNMNQLLHKGGMSTSKASGLKLKKRMHIALLPLVLKDLLSCDCPALVCVKNDALRKERESFRRFRVIKMATA